MLVTNLTWSNSSTTKDGQDTVAADIHLLPGLSSARLDQLLWITTDQGPGAHRADSGGSPATATFAAAFDQPTPGGFNHGIKIDAHTGMVTVADPMPAGPRLRSFIVTATVTLGTSTMQLPIRIHVHATLVKTWLTPSSLTVRTGATNMRFSVLGQFDDGVIGDISNWSLPALEPGFPNDARSVHHTGTAVPMHRWEMTHPTPSPSMTIDAATGEITCTNAGEAATVNLHVDMGSPVATATAFSAAPWSTPVPITPVAGPGVAAIAQPDIHNILFLPDGFTGEMLSTDQLDFEATVRGLVHLLSTNSVTKPYDVLHGKLNYFSAWVPSPQGGVSALREAYSVDPADPVSGNVIGKNVEIPAAPTGVPATLSLAELIHTVGLPTPVFDSPGSDPGDHINDWKQLYGTLPDATRITDDVYAEWLALGSRVLINERDTAFHIADGDRPRIDTVQTSSNDLRFHPRRLTWADYQTFLRSLVGPNNETLPPVWTEGAKDGVRVVFICRTRYYGGQNNIVGTGRYLCIGVSDDLTRVYRDVGTGFDLVPDPVPDPQPDHVEVGPWTTLAHELGHTFTLDDEYSRGGALPDAAIPDILLRPNTQDRKSLDKAGRLAPDAIKWRWWRLRQAAVLRDPSSTVRAVIADPHVAGQFLLQVAPGQGAAFDDEDVDIIRLCKPGPTRPGRSDQLRKIRVDHDQIVVAPIQGATLNPASFNAGDLVIAPMRDTDPDPSHDKFGKELELVHRLVVDQITATGNPLNALLTDPHNRPTPSLPTDHQPVPATNLPANLVPPAHAYQIIGLYEGGHYADSGAYHPAGECTMRVHDYEVHSPTDPDIVTMRTGVSFCMVCQYALVDLIDPSAHGLIDKEYGKIYPKIKP